MTEICDRLTRVRAQIARAERRYGRTPGCVTLLAVSKAQTVEQIRDAMACQQRSFGESYLQEAKTKNATRVPWVARNGRVG